MSKYDVLPQALKSIPQWVCTRGDSKKPLCAFGGAASSTDSTTWCDYNTANALVEIGVADYLGFVLCDNNLVAIDIDDVVTDGKLSEVAQDIIEHCKSYTELSKSGTGIHIIVKGDLPFKGRNNLSGVEIYKTARYFILTGDKHNDYALCENQAAIDYIVNKYFQAATKQNSGARNERIYTPIWEYPTDGKIKLFPTYPPINDGSRNVCLLSLAGTLHRAGYDLNTMYEELKRANETACIPPLDEYEIQAICNSVTRYAR